MDVASRRDKDVASNLYDDQNDELGQLQLTLAICTNIILCATSETWRSMDLRLSDCYIDLSNHAVNCRIDQTICNTVN